MNPNKVDRRQVHCLTDLPNVGPACAQDLRRIGIDAPAQLCGRDPYAMYAQLCVQTGQIHDPCVIDVFLSITRFIDGAEAQPWWAFTAERKRALSGRGAGR